MFKLIKKRFNEEVKCNHEWRYKHHKFGYKATCIKCNETRIIREL